MKVPHEQISLLKNLPKPSIIAVSGFGGSGKSTFATLLGKELNAPVIGIDSFTKDRNLTNYHLWSFIDFERLAAEILKPTISGATSLTYGHFDWNLNTISESRTVNHNGIIIVEGVGLLRPELLSYFAYTIWIDCSLEEAIRRGKKRDQEVHHNPQDEHWDGEWKENDTEYFETFTPKEKARFVFNNFEVIVG